MSWKPGFSGKLRLRTAFVVPIVILIGVAVGSVGYISFRNGQRAIEDLSLQLRGELTDRMIHQLKNYVDTTFVINELNAKALQNGQIDPFTGLGEQQLWQQTKLFPYASGFYCASDRDGAFMSVGHLRKNKPLLVSQNNPQDRFFRNYYAIDDMGKRGAIVERLEKKYDPRLRPWYIKSKAAGQPVWSDIYLDFNTSLPTVTASTPVYSQPSNALLGVCAVDLFLPQEFSKFLQAFKLGKSGVAFVVDRQGLMVASSTKASLFIGSGDQTKRLSASDYSHPYVSGTAKFLSDRYNHDLSGNLSQIRSPEFLDIQIDGQRQFVQVVPFQDGRGLDWTIVLSIPAADFTERIDASNIYAIGLSFLALAIALLIGIVITRSITAPILKVAGVAREISEGDYNRRAESSAIIEIDTLAIAFNTMADRLENAIATLEEGVRERTTQLSQANQEILTLNQKLQSDNLRLSAEVNVARRIQHMILPKPEELHAIAGLEVAGFMEPAAEVGGDYYDIFQVDGTVTIGIGDVTGHGLESGILMLMTQTSVRTLAEMREHNAVAFLSTLNRTLYHNIKRMNSDKNLTLAILNYEDGHLSISGQHEEALIVRTSGAIERIDTIDLGFPVGLEPDISAFIDRQALYLEPGDGVVMYTDGITEAANPEHKLYGMERLCEVITSSWQSSAEEIIQAVITDVRRHVDTQKVYDDLTLLVLKRSEP
jgi:phosphoserine phosphatase RsbU/P